MDHCATRCQANPKKCLQKLRSRKIPLVVFNRLSKKKTLLGSIMSTFLLSLSRRSVGQTVLKTPSLFHTGVVFLSSLGKLVESELHNFAGRQASMISSGLPLESERKEQKVERMSEHHQFIHHSSWVCVFVHSVCWGLVLGAFSSLLWKTRWVRGPVPFSFVVSRCGRFRLSSSSCQSIWKVECSFS